MLQKSTQAANKSVSCIPEELHFNDVSLRKQYSQSVRIKNNLSVYLELVLINIH